MSVLPTSYPNGVDKVVIVEVVFQIEFKHMLLNKGSNFLMVGVVYLSPILLNFFGRKDVVGGDAETFVAS